jgi:PAS domain S-box-containing protein
MSNTPEQDGNYERLRILYDSVLHNSADGILVLDGANRILSWNTGAERIFGYPGAEVLGRSFEMFLPEDLKQRLGPIAGRLLTKDGVLVISAQETRSQERNREIALQKLVALLRKAAQRPKRRIATRPTRASKTRRLDSKAKRSTTKKLRGSKPDTD